MERVEDTQWTVKMNQMRRKSYACYGTVLMADGSVGIINAFHLIMFVMEIMEVNMIAVMVLKKIPSRVVKETVDQINGNVKTANVSQPQKYVIK